MLRGQIADIIVGSIFLFIGLAACCIAAIRRRSGVRIFVWLGIWSAIYGAEHLSRSPAVLGVSPRWLQMSAPYADAAMTYLAVVFGSLSFLELSVGTMRFLNRAGAFLGLVIAVAGTGFFVLTGSYGTLLLYNNLLEACLLLVLMTVVAVPALSGKYLVLSDRGVLATGTFISPLKPCGATYRATLVSRLRRFSTTSVSPFFYFRLDMSLCKWSLRTSAACSRLKRNSRSPARYRLRSFRVVFRKSTTSA